MKKTLKNSTEDSSGLEHSGFFDLSSLNESFSSCVAKTLGAVRLLSIFIMSDSLNSLSNIRYFLQDKVDRSSVFSHRSKTWNHLVFKNFRDLLRSSTWTK